MVSRTKNITNDQHGLQLSQQAAKYLTEYLQRQPTPSALCLAVKKAGCSGYMFDVTSVCLADLAGEAVFNVQGVLIYVPADSLVYTHKLTLDYEKSVLNEFKLVFSSPFMSSSCGCGDSYQFNFSQQQHDEESLG